ncbi:MAG: phosphotransferase, partial [Planctomycetes bacterium]|nr:phosphotransferase [Planctomycetota bacterium]
MATRVLAGLEENLRFLILEVRKLVVETRGLLANAEPAATSGSLAKDDYIDNLRSIIHSKSFDLARTATTKSDRDRLQSIDRIATELERIADFCEHIFDQVHYVDPPSKLAETDFGPYFEDILGAVDDIEPALFKRDIKKALDICRAEDSIDRTYLQFFRDSIRQLESGGRAGTIVTMIFIHRYLERVGDSLLNIGEAVMSSILGERIKIGSFRALEETTEDSIVSGDIVPSLEAVGETKSGHRISRVRRSGATRDDKPVIFKEGRRQKLVEEREAILRWQTIAPDLVPEIYAFHDHEEHASILFEYIEGRTFEQILLNGTMPELGEALSRITSTLDGVWTSTRKDEAVAGKFSAQLASRLPAVFGVHPEFRTPHQKIGGVEAASFEELVARARVIDDAHPAPFSVQIHGDFNVDNIIIDEAGGRLHFIDLHRSRSMDYAQDVSVFLVSNYRLRVFDAQVRARI